MPDTELLPPAPDGVNRAAAILRAGGLVAFPTETVYGLGGDARSERAVAQIFAAKGRPRFNPLIAHVADLAAAERLAMFDDRARAMAAAFWPGPLTMVLPLRPGAGLCDLVTAGLPTVALRVPSHPLARALLEAFGGPLAAPSANPSGRISPTRAAHVMDGLAGRIDAVLDGGACAVGLESTIIGFSGIGFSGIGFSGIGQSGIGQSGIGVPGRALLLRPGGIAVETIELVLGEVLGAAGVAALPTAPGQLASHYAPAARLRLNASGPRPGEVWIGFGPGAEGGLNLSPEGDLVAAAAALFHALRQADLLAGPGGSIAVAPVPQNGLGLAINDRLRRAAAPRP